MLTKLHKHISALALAAVVILFTAANLVQALDAAQAEQQASEGVVAHSQNADAWSH